jgi:D-2-hydroxyacid dehydrogenase (NADP+)
VLVVVNLAVEHPAWALPPEQLGRLRDSFPEAEFHWNQQRKDFFRRAAEAEIIWGWQLTDDIFQLASKLKWFHSCAAGVKPSLSPTVVKSALQFTNSSSVNAPIVVEHLLALLLVFFRRLNSLAALQQQRRWGKEDYTNAFASLYSFDDLTVGICGYGAIGSRLASIVKLMGSRVFVYRRNPLPAQSADAVFTGNDYANMLARCDLVIDALAETTETEGFFTAEAFRAMKRGAIFANVGRGNTVDERALQRALGYDERQARWTQDNWLAGAVLDVFSQEPLPADSPLWSAPNVLISPHVAAVSPGFWRRQCGLFGANLRRYLNNEPLQELIDLQSGY